MATLLHHIQRWMQRSISEVEERLEWKMVQHTEWKIAEVHQRLDAFELRVLARPAPRVDVSTLQAEVDNLRADIDTILEARVPESEACSIEPAEDTVLAALFATSEIPPPHPREHAKRRRVEQRERREHGRRNVVRWRLRGEPHLLRRRCTRWSKRVSVWGVKLPNCGDSGRHCRDSGR